MAFVSGTSQLLVFALICCTAGCAGERPSRDYQTTPKQDFTVGDAWVPKDSQSVKDSVTPVADQAPTPCSATGVAASCDPGAGTGCVGSACYVVAGIGTACVCPAGGAQEGQPCNTTIECASGLGCRGKTPPGTCRKFCIKATPVCGTGRVCKSIDAFPQYGLCVLP